MATPSAIDTDFLLGELQRVLQSRPDDVYALCGIGYRLTLAGRADDARRCYRKAVDGLKKAARAGDVQGALDCEGMIYDAFVTPIEDEQHYYRCFADWKDDLAALGKRYRDPAATAGARRGDVGFLLQTGALLGHAEVLFEMLEARPRMEPGAAAPQLYVLGKYQREFMARAQVAGVEVVVVLEAMGRGGEVPWLDRLLWLRERFRRDGVQTCVWVSTPPLAAFALSMRLAPVQIYWALRFHPITGPNLEGHITWGAPDETMRRIGKQDWEVVPMSLATHAAAPPAAEIEAVRARFPERVLLGTLAREEKINSEPFLKAVTRLLACHPEAGFLWTGRSEHAGVAGALGAAGVAERCHFVGWVDTRLYAAALDVFLDTIPVGSGVTSLQALAGGTPLLSHLHPQSIFGTYFWSRVTAQGSTEPKLGAPDEYPILCARNGDEYVAVASRLVTDAPWRQEVGARGQAFYREELGNSRAYAERLFATISRIATARSSGA